MHEHFSPAENSEQSLTLAQKRAQLSPRLQQINLEELTRFGAPFVTEEDLILACAKAICNAHILSLLSDSLLKEADKKHPGRPKRHLSPEKRQLLKGSIERVLRMDDRVFLNTYTAVAKLLIQSIKERFPELAEKHPFSPNKKYQEAIRVKSIRPTSGTSPEIAI